MKKNAITLQIFMGYQIDSDLHVPNDYQKLSKNLIELLSMGEPSVNAEISYGDFPAGVQLWEEVLSQISLCDVAIFDISENNPNVLLEAGLGFGMHKLVILLRSDSATVRTPADLTSFVYLPYKHPNGLHSKSLARNIEKAIRRMLNKGPDDLFYFRQLWSLHPKTRTYVLPGTLPEGYDTDRFEDFIRLRNYTDLDALFLVAETLTRLYPEMNVSVRSIKSTAELPENWMNSNLVIVGGPDYNILVDEFDDQCPIEYLYGDKGEVWLRHKRTRHEYVPTFTSKRGTRIAQDYGFFLKTSLNDHGHGKLVFIGGARTWGVYGAAMLVGCRGFLDEASNAKSVRSIVERLGSDPSFIITVQVKGTTTGVNALSFRLEDIEPL